MRKKLEEEKGIIIRFVIGHSAISGGIVDRAIEAEDKKHGDFMRLVRYHFIWFTYRYLMPHSLLDPHVVLKPLLLPICFLL